MVGERALTACYDEPDSYSVYQSQWAEPSRLINEAAHGRCPLDRTATSQRWDRCSQSKWADLVDELDYLQIELCLRCDPDAVTAYLPIWLGIPSGDDDQTDPACGALLRVESAAECARLSDRIRRHKERLGAAIERGSVGLSGAQQTLLGITGVRERYLSASASERCFDSSE